MDYGIYFPGPLGGAANYCAERVTDEDTKAARSLALETCRWAGFEPGSSRHCLFTFMLGVSAWPPDQPIRSTQGAHYKGRSLPQT